MFDHRLLPCMSVASVQASTLRSGVMAPSVSVLSAVIIRCIDSVLSTIICLTLFSRHVPSLLAPLGHNSRAPGAILDMSHTYLPKLHKHTLFMPGTSLDNDACGGGYLTLPGPVWVECRRLVSQSESAVKAGTPSDSLLELNWVYVSSGQACTSASQHSRDAESPTSHSLAE
jgi:hypothetical protein